MRKIKQNDEVIVITGKYKGKTGKVLRVVNAGVKLVVEGINLVKKHVKPNPQAQESGGIVEKEAPIQASNVAIYNSATQKADRVGFKIVDNKKRRYFKSNDELIDL